MTFGKQRQDLVASLSLEWTKRDWRLYGFAPTTGYQYTEAFSNLEIFSYSRHSVNFGMARSFWLCAHQLTPASQVRSRPVENDLAGLS